MRHVSLLLFVLFASNASCQKKEQPIAPPPVATNPKPAKEYTFSEKPVWQDEFDYNGKPDPAKWDYELGGSGWGNNELQNYTDSLVNAVVKDGHLVITARKESSGNRQFSSARLLTKGKGDFLYGKIEVKARLPKGVGTWPRSDAGHRQQLRLELLARQR